MGHAGCAGRLEVHSAKMCVSFHLPCNYLVKGRGSLQEKGVLEKIDLGKFRGIVLGGL